MSTEHYYWFYSTLAQVLGAIIALLGVFSIYALQKLSENIEYIRNKLIRWYQKYEPHVRLPSLEYRSIDELIEISEKEFDKSSKEHKEKGKRLIRAIKVLKTAPKKVKQGTKIILIWAIILLGLSLVLLHFCPTFEVYKITGKWVVMLMLVSSLLLFYFIGKFINNTLKVEYDKVQEGIEE